MSLNIFLIYILLNKMALLSMCISLKRSTAQYMIDNVSGCPSEKICLDKVLVFIVNSVLIHIKLGGSQCRVLDVSGVCFWQEGNYFV